MVLLSVILFSAFAPGSVQQAFGQKQEIRVLSHSQFIGSDGLLHVVGEVENNLYGKVATDIKVYSMFHGQNITDTITVSSAYTYIDSLHPGERSPFSIVVRDQTDIQDIQGYKLTAISKNQTAMSALPANLKISIGESQLNQSGAYSVAGKLVNYGSEIATQITVAACFYDANGTVIYSTYEYFPSELEATETMFFDFEVSEINATDISYASIYAESAEYSAVSATTSGSPKLYSASPTTLAKDYSITLVTDSDTYTGFQEINAAGKVSGLGLAFSEVPGEIKFATIEIRTSDRRLYYLDDVPIAGDGSYNYTSIFYAPAEYDGHQFVIKARYETLVFTEKTFTYISGQSSEEESRQEEASSDEGEHDDEEEPSNTTNDSEGESQDDTENAQEEELEWVSP